MTGELRLGHVRPEYVRLRHIMTVYVGKASFV